MNLSERSEWSSEDPPLHLGRPAFLSLTVFEVVSRAGSKPGIPKAPRLQQRDRTLPKGNFSDESGVEDPGEAWLAERSKRRGTASQGQGQGHARQGPNLKTGAVAAPGSAPEHSVLSDRSQKTKKLALGRCEELGSEIMRTTPEEELTETRWK